jgi:hypothetical protein
VTDIVFGRKETRFRREKLLCLYAMGLIFFHGFIIACPELVMKEGERKNEQRE